MHHTLLAVFGNRTEAQDAMNALISSGFPREEIQLSDADPTGMTDSTTGGRRSAPSGATGAGSVASLGRVFTDLFGADNSIRASRYAGTVTRGHHVLIVRADSLSEAERAADIVEPFGPSDIDAQASQASAMGTGSMQQAQRENAAHASPLEGVYTAAYSYGAEMRRSALYRNRPWDDVEGDLARAWDARSGLVIEGAWDRMKAAVRHGWERMTADDDDREFRSHWKTRYGGSTDATYEQYQPAYAYGAAMARDERYRGRRWPEVENDLRTDWERRYGSGGQSTWENVMPAVRHAWNRLAS